MASGKVRSGQARMAQLSPEERRTLASNAAKEPLVAASAWWILACDAAARGDLSTYDRCAREAIELGQRGVVEVDMATVAQRAGDLVAVHDRARARKAWQFANEKWKQLGRPPP